MNLLKRLAVFLIALVALTGCSNKNVDVGRLQRAFESVSAENKTELDKGIAAIAITNYPAALESLEKMAYRPRLTVEQRKALQAAIARLKERVPKSAP